MKNNLWVVNYSSLRRYNASTMELLIPIATKVTPYHSLCMATNFGSQTRLFYFRHTNPPVLTPVPEAIARHPQLASAEIDYIHPYGSHALLLNTTKYGMFCYNYKEGTVTHQSEDGFPFEVPRLRLTSCLLIRNRICG